MNNIELLEKRWVSWNKIKWNSIELLEKKIERDFSHGILNADGEKASS
jgi:hypothetical protein